MPERILDRSAFEPAPASFQRGLFGPFAGLGWGSCRDGFWTELKYLGEVGGVF